MLLTNRRLELTHLRIGARAQRFGVEGLQPGVRRKKDEVIHSRRGREEDEWKSAIGAGVHCAEAATLRKGRALFLHEAQQSHQPWIRLTSHLSGKPPDQFGPALRFPLHLPIEGLQNPIVDLFRSAFRSEGTEHGAAHQRRPDVLNPASFLKTAKTEVDQQTVTEQTKEAPSGAAFLPHPRGAALDEKAQVGQQPFVDGGLQVEPGLLSSGERQPFAQRLVFEIGQVVTQLERPKAALLPPVARRWMRRKVEELLIRHEPQTSARRFEKPFETRLGVKSQLQSMNGCAVVLPLEVGNYLVQRDGFFGQFSYAHVGGGADLHGFQAPQGPAIVAKNDCDERVASDPREVNEANERMTNPAPQPRHLSPGLPHRDSFAPAFRVGHDEHGTTHGPSHHDRERPKPSQTMSWPSWRDRWIHRGTAAIDYLLTLEEHARGTFRVSTKATGALPGAVRVLRGQPQRDGPPWVLHYLGRRHPPEDLRAVFLPGSQEAGQGEPPGDTHCDWRVEDAPLWSRRPEALYLPLQLNAEHTLTGSYADFAANLTKDHRRALKQSESLGLTCTPGDFSEVDDFYSSMLKPSAIHRYGPAAHVPSLGQVHRKRNALRFYWVVSQGERLAGGLVLHSVWRGRMELWRVGLAPRAWEDRKLSRLVYTALDAHTLRKAYELGSRVFSLGRSLPAVNDGLFLYKRRWGMDFVPNGSGGWVRFEAASERARSSLAKWPLVVWTAKVPEGPVLLTSVPSGADESATLRKLWHVAHFPSLKGMLVFRPGQDEPFLFDAASLSASR